MYGVAGEKRPIFSELDAFLYNLGDPSIGSEKLVKKRPIWRRQVDFLCME